MIARDLLLAQPQEARRIVVKNVALLFRSQEIGVFDGSVPMPIVCGQIIWSEPNMIRLPKPASTSRRSAS